VEDTTVVDEAVKHTSVCIKTTPIGMLKKIEVVFDSSEVLGALATCTPVFDSSEVLGALATPPTRSIYQCRSISGYHKLAIRCSLTNEHKISSLKFCHFSLVELLEDTEWVKS